METSKCTLFLRSFEVVFDVHEKGVNVLNEMETHLPNSSSTPYYSHVMLRCLYCHLLMGTKVVDPLQPLDATAPNFFLSLLFWGELWEDWMEARLRRRT